MSNYYELLNVDARASTDDIKKAFREQAKQLHPDRNPGGGPELQQRFSELAEAYEVSFHLWPFNACMVPRRSVAWHYALPLLSRGCLRS